MQKLGILLIALFITTFSQAQDAKTLLKEVSAKAKSYDNISIDLSII